MNTCNYCGDKKTISARGCQYSEDTGDLWVQSHCPRRRAPVHTSLASRHIQAGEGEHGHTPSSTDSSLCPSHHTAAFISPTLWAPACPSWANPRYDPRRIQYLHAPRATEPRRYLSAWVTSQCDGHPSPACWDSCLSQHTEATHQPFCPQHGTEINQHLNITVKPRSTSSHGFSCMCNKHARIFAPRQRARLLL